MTTRNLLPHRARGERRKLPDERRGFTQKVTIDGQHKLYIRTGEYEEGTLGEIFLDMHKQGERLQAFTHNFAIAVSTGLQYGVPLEEFIDSFVGHAFTPSGQVTSHRHIRSTTSILDLVFRHLGIKYLGRTDLIESPAKRERSCQIEPACMSTRWGERSILPHRRLRDGTKLTVGGQKFYLEVGHYGMSPMDPIGEIFITMHKEGDDLRAIMNAFGIAVSIGLQYGVPLREFVDSFIDTRFEPSGSVRGAQDEQVFSAKSYFDCMFRILGIRYLDLELKTPHLNRTEPQAEAAQ